MGRYKKYVIIILLLGLVGTIFLYSYLRPQKPKILKTAKIVRGPLTAFVEETGIVKPQVGALVKVGTRATGLLTYLPYQVGDYVKKGELLAKIDDREILANLKSAKAELKNLQGETLRKKRQTEDLFEIVFQTDPEGMRRKIRFRRARKKILIQLNTGKKKKPVIPWAIP